jgi:esterase
VILVDLRNHGRSPHYPEHTFSEMVLDLASLLENLKIEKAHLLGHSMGGKTAMKFAADYPEKTISLTVADIAPVDYLENPASALQYAFHKKIMDAIFALDMSSFSTRSETETALASEIPDLSLRKFLLKNVYRNENGQFAFRMNVPFLRAALPQIISGANFHEFEDRIPILTYPVHFIKGELSDYITDEHWLTIKNIYPEAKLTRMKGASHFLHAEFPEGFARMAMNSLP